jgi:AraC-like DNA-binding protein
MGPLLQHLYLACTASGVMLGLIFAVSLSRPQGTATRANRLLAAIFATFACSIVANAALNIVLPQEFPYVRSFAEPFILLVGPFFYCYIHRLSSSPARNIYVHFLPFVTAAVYGVFLSAWAEDSMFSHRGLSLINAAVGFAVYAQLWIYYLWNRQLLQVYREQLKQSCSSIEKITQSWIAYILLALLVCYTFVGLVYWRSHTDADLPVNQILAGLLSCIVFMLAYRMLRQPEIFAAMPDQKYQKSGLAEAAVADEFNRLEDLMDNDKPYMDAELNLQGLAEQTQLSPHHLSQVINHGSRSNFYEFVNEFRTREVQRLIADPDNDRLTVLELAYTAGFNSKATFNRFFKKATGRTPTQFRKELSR